MCASILFTAAMIFAAVKNQMQEEEEAVKK
jgi:hypothetical protein